METKLFTKNDSGFICENCGREVPPLGYSSRNHCPYCLYSKHVDVNPGDRANECGGLMEPYAVTVNAKKGFIITHKCKKCGEEHNNKMQSDDDTELLIKLTNPYNRGER
ncbi:MAG: RNHCP domain-containing protein [Clostridiales bacterium]|nr:RNHCP domain-containing protein [Candidatus Coliplasma equi]